MTESSLMLEQWCHQHLGQEYFEPNLNRVRSYLQLIPKKYLKHLGLITVAGTNGKGEVAHTSARLLHEQGLRVGLWTSPHIHSVCERFWFNGAKLSGNQLLPALKGLKQRGRALGFPGLSYYEHLFVTFLLLAHEQNISHLVLEVGLGGRLDAVNVLDANVVGIVSISRDHQEILGQSYRQILFEKWSVARKGSELITCFEQDYLKHLSAQFTKKFGVHWVDLFVTKVVRSEHTYSERNRLLARKLVERLVELPQEAPIHWLSRSINWGERAELMTVGDSRFIFKGAHNIDGIRVMLAQARTAAPLMLVGPSRSGLELVHILKVLKYFAKEGPGWRLTNFDHPKSCSKDELLRCLKQVDQTGQCMVYEQDWKNYLRSFFNQQEQIVVTGSYYFIGMVRNFLQQCNRDRGL